MQAEKDNLLAYSVLGVSVGLGLIIAGYFISSTIYKGKLASNAVTVKGSAERDVRSDLALWQIGYSLTGSDLPTLYGQSSSDESLIVSFLKQKGFKNTEIETGAVQVTDMAANQFRQSTTSDDRRFIVKDTITVRSNNVALVALGTTELSELIKQGLVLTTNNVDFEYTKLNDIRSAMLRSATENARAAAQQFANDANSRVGSIQSANQGFFSIDSRDSAASQNPDQANYYYDGQQASTVEKRVRVVVTLTYYLEK